MADLEATLRTDARANRGRILEVARKALTSDPAVSLNAIAKMAGVGAGTLYRHFPSREALVIGVYRRELDELVELAPRLLAEHPPLHAFRMWCDRLVLFGRTKHGVADMLPATTTEQDFQGAYGPLLNAVRQLMVACDSSGDIRTGLDAQDFLISVSFLWQLPPGLAGEARAKRLLALVFRGLGTDDPAQPKPVRS